MKKIWYAFMLLAIGLVSCNKTDDLWDEVNDLKDRVTSLETQIKDLNWNIEAIRELAKEGATITGIEEKDGAYKITMSDGKVLNLIQQTENSNLLPIVGIDSDGYWVVSYNGKPATRIKDTNGEDIMAKGENGVTPKFSVDAEGYWLIQYGTDAASRVKDENGNDVKATGDSTGGASDSFFEKVEKRENELYIKLATGEEMIIPIVSNFSCVIDATGVQVFTAGEVKSFNVAMKGVENTMVTTPNGWKAELSKDEAKADDATAYILKVTAPSASATPSTRASADNSKDIAILATSGAYACIAKIQVELKMIIDYKAMFDAGEDIVIGDVTINSQTYTAESLSLTNVNIDISPKITGATGPLVLFLEDTSNGNNEYQVATGGGGSSNYAVTSYPIAIIGRYADSKPKVNFVKSISAKSDLTVSNVELILGNFMTNAAGNSATGILNINNCISKNCIKAFAYLNTANAGFTKINIENSEIQYTANTQMINLGQTNTPNVYTKINIKNNIIYANDGTNFTVPAWLEANTTAANPETTRTINIENNTFVNLIYSNTVVSATHAKSLIIKKNIFYGNNKTGQQALYKFVGTAYSTSTTFPTIDVNDNIIYDETLKDNANWIYCHTTSTIIPGSNNKITPATTPPFENLNVANGIFEVKAEFADYGAKAK